MYAWRTLEGEQYKFNKKIKTNDKHKIIHSCNWYYCDDKNMENELVLVYSIEKSSNPDEINLLYKDKFLQTITASGKECSGKISKWVKNALPGSFNPNGTEIIKF
jgi:hypothetical protein